MQVTEKQLNAFLIEWCVSQHASELHCKQHTHITLSHTALLLAHNHVILYIITIKHITATSCYFFKNVA